jgi:hypothetical protein
MHYEQNNCQCGIRIADCGLRNVGARGARPRGMRNKDMEPKAQGVPHLRSPTLALSRFLLILK